MSQIKLNGKMHPVKFGMGALIQYERKTGRSAIEDFQTMSGGSPRLSVVADLIYAGITCGYRQFQKLPDFTEDDLADWLDNESIAEMMQMFQDSFPQQDAGNANSPAKPTKQKRA